MGEEESPLACPVPIFGREEGTDESAYSDFIRGVISDEAR